jgi:hypothetical protein
MRFESLFRFPNPLLSLPRGGKRLGDLFPLSGVGIPILDPALPTATREFSRVNRMGFFGSIRHDFLTSPSSFDPGPTNSCHSLAFYRLASLSLFRPPCCAGGWQASVAVAGRRRQDGEADSNRHGPFGRQSRGSEPLTHGSLKFATI